MVIINFVIYIKWDSRNGSVLEMTVFVLLKNL